VKHECSELPEHFEIGLNYECGVDPKTYYWQMSYSFWNLDDLGEAYEGRQTIESAIKFCPFCGKKLD
jgi:hypothetical protein